MRPSAIEFSGRFFRGLSWVAVAAGAIALVRDTRYQGQDFEVFWRAGRALWEGRALYDLSRDGAMVFKYPPWIAPFFIPLAWLPLDWAKWIWGGIQVLSLVGIVRWLRRAGAPFGAVAFTLLCFWGIWAVHALDGQVPLVMLVVALWLGSSRGTGAGVAVLLALSAKIFSAFSVLGARALLRNPRPWILAAGAALVLSIPAASGQPDGMFGLVPAWLQAAGSGSQYFGTKVWGRDNQGLPALILRHFESPTPGLGWELGLTLAWMIALGLGWYRAAQPLNEAQRWAGWLALSAVVHPLSWFHQFVFAFPAAVLALSAAWRTRDRTWTGLAILGIACIGAVTAKTLGELGLRFELLSGKSWGVLLCLAVLARTGRRVERRRG